MKLRIPDFAAGHVLALGDLMLDRYWHGDTSRISPEAPVPVVHVGEAEERPGGAGNVALNVAVLGGRVSLIVGVTVAALSSAIGIVLGLLAGFVRPIEGLVMRVMDGLMAIPGILLAIALMTIVVFPSLVGAALWLLSPASSFVTGAIIPIDGGFSAYSGV